MTTITRRTRTLEGRFTAKRGDTKMGEIERRYKIDFGVHSNMKLGTYLEQKGLPSLSKLLAGSKHVTSK